MTPNRSFNRSANNLTRQGSLVNSSRWGVSLPAPPSRQRKAHEEPTAVLLNVYFWFMLVYVVVALVTTPFVQKRLPSTAKYTRGAWLEQGASYVLLGLGLLGVYGYVNAVPILMPAFWKVFLLCLILFSALQHRMPKTKLLRDAHGAKAVVVATVVGVVMLLPMVYAVGAYALGSHAVWTPA